MQTDRDKQFADLTQFGYYTNEKLNWNRKNSAFSTQSFAL